MSFLKKIGGAILKGLAYASGIMPIVQQSLQPVLTQFPTAANIFEKINSAIQDVEVIGQATQTPGPNRLALAVPLVSAALLKYTNDLGHKIKDEALFQKAAAEYAQASVDLQNSLE